MLCRNNFYFFSSLKQEYAYCAEYLHTDPYMHVKMKLQTQREGIYA